MASAIILDWVVATDYVADEVVTVLAGEGPQYANKLYRCESAHTSVSFTTDWGNSLWEEIVIQGTQGQTGDQGASGPTGAAGSNGSQGPTGAAGANGIFSAIASQGEAEAGTDNTKGMTPLRVAEAIAVTVIPSEAALQASIVALDGRVDDVEARMAVVENGTDLTFASGQQRVNNNQAAPQDILGVDLPTEAGKGNRFELNPVGAKSAIVRVEIYREDDAEIRFTIAELELHFVNGTWLIGRFKTLVLAGGDDGLTFDVTQDGNDVATVNYISDNMVGGNYLAASYLKFELKEISNFS